MYTGTHRDKLEQGTVQKKQEDEKQGQRDRVRESKPREE